MWGICKSYPGFTLSLLIITDAETEIEKKCLKVSFQFFWVLISKIMQVQKLSIGLTYHNLKGDTTDTA